MRNIPQFLIIIVAFVMSTHALRGQNPTGSAGKTPPDVLLFKNGEKLMGQLQSATGSTVTFKSEMAGVVTVEWNKVQELQTSERFAVVPKGVTLRHADDTAKVSKGTIAVKARAR